MMSTMVSNLELKDYLSLGLGGTGFLLSLATWIRTIFREYRRLKVRISPAFFVYANGEISTQMASIDVANVGSRPIFVKAPTLRTPKGKHLSFAGADDFKKFPRRLDEGVTYAEIAITLKKQGYSKNVKLVPWCLDATGKRHKGRGWKLDLSKDWIGK